MHVECHDDPMLIHRDVGGGKRFPVDRANLLLRGCVLRNTTRVAGLVVYAGVYVYIVLPISHDYVNA